VEIIGENKGFENFHQFYSPFKTNIPRDPDLNPIPGIGPFF